jgi:hypothetical protein
VADAPALRPGFYTFESGGKTLATVAMNVDPMESDLAPIEIDSLRAGSISGRVATLTSSSGLAAHLTETRRGRELWLGFLLAAVLALAAELALGSARTIKP